MMLERCVMCDGKLKKKEVEYVLSDVDLGKFPAWVCQCGEQYFDEETANSMTEAAKRRGVFGLAKKTKVGYTGKSLMVRIPKEIVEFLGLKKGGGGENNP
ncbi:MAG: YgiT-type zinc finger protein [Methanobacteriota archaeon]